MKHYLSLILACTVLQACLSDKHDVGVFPQKIYSAVSAKYPNEKNTLMFVGAPEGFIAPRFATSAVEDNVNVGRVAAIVSALALKNSTVVIAGEDETLTAATLAKALTIGKEKIGGAKAIIVGSKDAQKMLSAAATASKVTLGFMDNPN